MKAAKRNISPNTDWHDRLMRLQFSNDIMFQPHGRLPAHLVHIEHCLAVGLGDMNAVGLLKNIKWRSLLGFVRNEFYQMALTIFKVGINSQDRSRLIGWGILMYR